MKVKTLIVGLGNPGQKYEQTRHNVGFVVLDSFCVDDFKLGRKFDAELCDQGDGTVLVKPQTFMNLSGEAVKAFVDYYKVEPQNIWVVHDDVDIPFGEIRVRKGGSSAGHKGVDSIIESLGTQDFLRFRVGVKNEDLGRLETEDFVLQRFSKDEEREVPKIVDLCVKEIKEILANGDKGQKTLKI